MICVINIIFGGNIIVVVVVFVDKTIKVLISTIVFE